MARQSTWLKQGIVLAALALWGAVGPVSMVLAADTAHGAAEHPSKTNPLSIDVDLGIVTLIVFSCLLAILWKFAWGPIAAGLEKRERGIADNIAAAQTSHEQAKQLLADYERKLSGAAGEVRDMLESARKDADRVKQEIIAEARTAAQGEQQRAALEIRSATDQALGELAAKSADLAVDLAGKILGQKIQAADHAKLVQDAVTQFAAPSRN
jgi:F-type H+-transporting ATPase subunit b